MLNVNRVKGRDGVYRLYFRKRGHPSVPLKSAWGTKELEEEVKALRAGTEPKPRPGTLTAALRVYELESADYAALAASTKYEYGLILKELEEDFGVLPIASFTAKFILELRNIWAKRGHRAANVRLQVLKNVLTPSIIAGDLGQGDPFSLIPQVRRPANAAEPHEIWPESVVRVVAEEAIKRERYGLARAVVIGRYVGCRRGDLVKLTSGVRVAVGDDTRRFRFLSGKRKIPVDMPEDPELTAWLERIPARQPDKARPGRKVKPGAAQLQSITLVFNLEGTPYTEDGLGQELAKLVLELAEAKKIPSSAYTLHGLRHTFGVEAALAGATDAQGAALMGHGSPHSFATYRRQADRIRMSNDAADKIAQLRERTRNAGVQNEVQNSCKTPEENKSGPVAGTLTA